MLLLLFYRASVSLSRQAAVTCSLLVSWRGQREKRARELEEEWRYCSWGEPIARFAIGEGINDTGRGGDACRKVEEEFGRGPRVSQLCIQGSPSPV